MPKKIGILGLHGSREEHSKAMQNLGFETVFLKTPKDFENIDGIILPGGESTSFGRLLNWSGIRETLTKKIIEEKLPVFGTCAGAILLAKKGSEYSLGALDIEIDRNAYGRQIDSFSTEISIQHSTFNIQYFKAIFIRAPKIIKTGKNIEILAKYEETPVLVADFQNHILAATFHPELTKDIRIHEIFAEMIL